MSLLLVKAFRHSLARVFAMIEIKIIRRYTQNYPSFGRMITWCFFGIGYFKGLSAQLQKVALRFYPEINAVTSK
jgi:hypothetical protein